LLASSRYERVIVVTRRELGPEVRHDKLRQVVVEFDKLGEARPRLRGDHVYCALGTTIRKAGSQERFREVDFEYRCDWRDSRSERRTALLGRERARRESFVVVLLFAVKGEMEEGLRQLGWPSLAILRPS